MVPCRQREKTLKIKIIHVALYFLTDEDKLPAPHLPTSSQVGLKVTVTVWPSQCKVNQWEALLKSAMMVIGSNDTRTDISLFLFITNTKCLRFIFLKIIN